VRHLVNFNNPVSLDNLGPHSRTDARKSRGVYDVGMNGSQWCPKRELSPLRRACLSLGLDVDARPKTNLARFLRKAGLGETAISYLGVSSDEQAQQIVALYQRLNATERKAVTIDYLVLAARADVHRILGCISAEQYRVAGVFACMDALKVMIERALTPDGYQDRRLLFQIVGVLPMPGENPCAAPPRIGEISHGRRPNTIVALPAKEAPRN